MWEQKIYQSKVPVLGVFRNALQYTLVEFFLFSNKIPMYNNSDTIDEFNQVFK